VVGERVLDRFTLERRLGSGGFGTVYRAWDERLQRPVAVKVVEAAGIAARRALREAQAAARLSHPSIATLYELAEDGTSAYLVGELVEGGTLRELASRGELSDRSLAEIGADAAEALAHAHRHGVVHRDVKPHNILVPRGTATAKLVDFGIARLAGEPALTASGMVMGTLAYMAPEQADGLRPGPAADTYSLALTLYECWSGEHPLLRFSPAATARAIGEPVPSLAEPRPDLPPELIDAVDACLDPDPERRPLVSELQRAMEASGPLLGGERLPPPIAPPEGDGALRPAGRPWLRVIAAVAVSLLCLAVLLWSGSPGAALFLSPLAGALALVRPRLAFMVAAAGCSLWLAVGAGEQGAALVVAVLSAPLGIPVGSGRGVALPALAPALALPGLAPAYPAVASFAGGAAARALLGAVGYIWMAAAESLSGRDLFLGPVMSAPAEWRDSAGQAMSGVVVPLAEGPVLAGALVWALAAVLLPVLVRGRMPILDALGALLWAAGLIAAHGMLAAPGGEARGGLLVVATAASLAALAASRLGDRGVLPALAGRSWGGGASPALRPSLAREP
jgi:hypothetical protein